MTDQYSYLLPQCEALWKCALTSPNAEGTDEAKSCHAAAVPLCQGICLWLHKQTHGKQQRITSELMRAAFKIKRSAMIAVKQHLITFHDVAIVDGYLFSFNSKFLSTEQVRQFVMSVGLTSQNFAVCKDVSIATFIMREYLDYRWEDEIPDHQLLLITQYVSYLRTYFERQIASRFGWDHYNYKIYGSMVGYWHNHILGDPLDITSGMDVQFSQDVSRSIVHEITIISEIDSVVTKWKNDKIHDESYEAGLRHIIYSKNSAITEIVYWPNSYYQFDREYGESSRYMRYRIPGSLGDYQTILQRDNDTPGWCGDAAVHSRSWCPFEDCQPIHKLEEFFIEQGDKITPKSLEFPRITFTPRGNLFF